MYDFSEETISTAFKLFSKSYKYLFWCSVPEFDKLLFSATFMITIIVYYLTLGATQVVYL